MALLKIGLSFCYYVTLVHFFIVIFHLSIYFCLVSYQKLLKYLFTYSRPRILPVK
jgi:hypothetical protein